MANLLTPTVLRIRATGNGFGYKLTNTHLVPFECIRIRPSGEDEEKVMAVVSQFLAGIPIEKELPREEGMLNLNWELLIQRTPYGKQADDWRIAYSDDWRITYYRDKARNPHIADCERIEGLTSEQIIEHVEAWVDEKVAIKIA